MAVAARAENLQLPVIGFAAIALRLRCKAPGDSFPPWPEGRRLHRGTERRDRVSLGGKSPGRLKAWADLIPPARAVIVCKRHCCVTAKAANTLAAHRFREVVTRYALGLVRQLNRPVKRLGEKRTESAPSWCQATYQSPYSFIRYTTQPRLSEGTCRARAQAIETAHSLFSMPARSRHSRSIWNGPSKREDGAITHRYRALSCSPARRARSAGGTPMGCGNL